MIDLDALKAAGLNSQANSERLLAEHRARVAQERSQSTPPPPVEPEAD